MNSASILRDYISSNGIKQNFIAEKIGMSPELLRRSLEGTRALKADEFIAICGTLSLDLNYFTSRNHLKPTISPH